MRLLFCLLLSSSLTFADPKILKVGSLTPRESPWGQVLRVWVKAVNEKTQGQVQIEMFWNGTQGDEGALISKMRLGQLAGAIVTGVGLSLIDPQVNVLQAPGLYADWSRLDKVRDAFRPRFDASFRKAGFELVGWGDIGLDRFMSKGFAVKNPVDLKGKHPWTWKEDPILPAVFSSLGVTPVATSVPEALPELSNGNVDCMSISALGAEQLQWSSRLDTINTMVVAPNIGGMVLTKSALDRLTAAERAAVLDAGRIAASALTERIRKEDALALERLKKRFVVVEPTPESLQLWKQVFVQARARLAEGTLSKAMLEEAQELAK